MSKKASPKAIGSFVVGAIVLLIAGVLVFSSGRFLKEMPTYVLFFEGAMGGLNIGAPVDFRGVKVGSVADVFVQFRTEDKSLLVVVIIEFEGKVRVAGDVGETRRKEAMQELIRRGLRAQIKSLSMVTGQKKIELDFHPEEPVRLLNLYPEYPELPTIPSDMEKLSQTIEDLPIQELFDKLLLAVEGIESMVNSPEVKGSVQALDNTLKGLEKLVKNVDGQVGSLGSEIEKTVKDARKLVNNLDEQAGSLSTNIEGTVKDTRKLVKSADETVKDTHKLVNNVDSRVESITSGIEKTTEEARSAFEQGKKTLSSTEEVIAKDSPLIYRLTETLEELQAAAHSLRSMADYLERHPDALLRGKGGPGGK